MLVPNVEFIFGLTGSTASVVIAYVLPAALFLSLSGRPALLNQLNPEDVRTGGAVFFVLFHCVCEDSRPGAASPDQPGGKVCQ